MINAFVVKKYSSLLLSSFLSTIMFIIGNIYYGFWGGYGFLGLGLLLALLVGRTLLKNPFSDMLEGKGILTINLDSTGVIRPFICTVNPPYIRGKTGFSKVDDVFDRESIMQMTPPVRNSTAVEIKKDGGINIDLDSSETKNAKFAFLHWPCIIYNEQMKTVLTKDFLSTHEKDTFAEHGVLYLNRKVEELTSVVRDFGRHVVETLKPKSSLFTNKFVWIFVIILMVILVALFAPAVLKTLGGTFGAAGGAVSTATGGGSGTIIPR